MLKRIHILILSRAIVFSVKLKVRAKISEKVNFEEYFLKEDLEKIVKALREKTRIDICSFCRKSVSKEPASCFHDCAGLYEALVRESKKKCEEKVRPTFYITRKFRDLDTKKYFTLRLIPKDSEDEDFIRGLAISFGHHNFREVHRRVIHNDEELFAELGV